MPRGRVNGQPAPGLEPVTRGGRRPSDRGNPPGGEPGRARLCLGAGGVGGGSARIGGSPLACSDFRQPARRPRRRYRGVAGHAIRRPPLAPPQESGMRTDGERGGGGYRPGRPARRHGPPWIPWTFARTRKRRRESRACRRLWTFRPLGITPGLPAAYLALIGLGTCPGGCGVGRRGWRGGWLPRPPALRHGSRRPRLGATRR